MFHLLLASVLNVGASQIDPALISPDVLARGRAIYQQHVQYECQRRLVGEASRSAWLNGMAPQHRFILGQVLKTTTSAKYQSVLDATYFQAPDARPVLISGPISAGKTMHLRALARYLYSLDVPTFALWRYDNGAYEIETRVAGVTQVRDFETKRPSRTILRDLIAKASNFAAAGSGAFLILDVSTILESTGSDPELPYTVARVLEDLDHLRSATGVNLLVSLHDSTLSHLRAELSARAYSNVLWRFVHLDLNEKPPDPFLEQLEQLIPRELHFMVR